MKRTKIEGDVTYNPSVDYSEVEEITGGLDCYGADTRAAFPRLSTVGGSLYCYGADTRAAFPRLSTVGGSLYCRGADTKAAFPRLTTVGGWLDCRGADTRAAFPRLSTVGGSLYCYGADTRAAFPRLSTVGGSLDCYGADTKAAFPRLSTVGGSLDCYGADTKAAFPRLSTVGGWLDCRGADTRAAFPRLSTVGGGLYCCGADTRAAFPRLTKKECGDAVARARVGRAFRRKGFLFADDILSEIVSTRDLRGGAKVHRIRVVGKTKVTYCIESDGTYSHGDTIKEARESLLYKVSQRDKSAYAGWKLDRKITGKEAIASYRVITGACEAGVRAFVQGQGGLRARYTVQEVINLTRGQYGHEVYAAFFKN